jgi:hypothetical protein
MITVRVPTGIWEVEFYANGDVEIERFASNGEIEGESILPELYAIFADRHR